MVRLSPRKHPPRMQSQLPGCTESTCIAALPVLHEGQPDGGERCIVLESGLTHSLIAKLPQHSSLAVCEFSAASEECCKQGYGQVLQNFDAGYHGA